VTSDRGHIENLIARFCDRFDHGHLHEAAELFSEDCVYHASFFTAHGRAELMQFWDENVILHERGTPETAHMHTNLDIDVDSENGRAEARSYMVCFQALEDFPLQATHVVRCIDRFSRSEGAWSWKERRILPYLYGDTSRHARRHNRPGPWNAKSSPPEQVP
jgi:hypothetical protein